MKLHTVFITYNRLELTKRAIASYLETVSVPWSMVVADNASKDGTQEWVTEFFAQSGLLGYENGTTYFPVNRYPGHAANEGWERAPDDVTHLHRADNDFMFLSGWCEEVERMFSENERLGQLGLRTDEEERFAKSNVGGNCIIRRELWDKGLRWDERPWPELKENYGPGYTEDSIMSHQVERFGWEWDRVERPCIQSLSVEDPHDEYYIKSWDDRGILRQARKAYGLQ